MKQNKKIRTLLSVRICTVLVDESGLAPESYRVGLSFLHTYSAFKLEPEFPTDGKNGAHIAEIQPHARDKTRTVVYRLINAALLSNGEKVTTDSA